MWLRKKKKKKLKSLIGFHSANKIDNYNRRGGEKKKFEKNKWKHKNTNFFLESLLSVLSLTGVTQSASPP